jgi:hypothetical protein
VENIREFPFQAGCGFFILRALPDSCNQREATLQPYLLALVRTSSRTSLKEGKLYHRLKGPLRGPSMQKDGRRTHMILCSVTGKGRSESVSGLTTGMTQGQSRFLHFLVARERRRPAPHKLKIDAHTHTPHKVAHINSGEDNTSHICLLYLLSQSLRYHNAQSP